MSVVDLQELEEVKGLLLKGQQEVLGRIVRYAAPRLPKAGKTRIVIDRDPVSLL